MTYYVISSNFIEGLPYLRIAYNTEEGKLVKLGYSHLADWKDATLFTDEGEARLVMSTNNPGKENLKLLKINVEIEEA